MNQQSQKVLARLLGFVAAFFGFWIVFMVSVWILLFRLPAFLDSFNGQRVRIPRILIWIWEFLDLIYGLPGFGPLVGMLLLSLVLSSITAGIVYIWITRISTPSQTSSPALSSDIGVPPSPPNTIPPLRRETIETEYRPNVQRGLNDDEEDNSWAESLIEEYDDGGVPPLLPLDLYNDNRIRELREMILEQLLEYGDFFRYGEERTGTTREQWLRDYPELNAFFQWCQSEHEIRVRRKVDEDTDETLEHYLAWEWL